jgi:hypothetical protein
MLRAVLTFAAVLACLRPAVAIETGLPFGPVEAQAAPTPPQIFVREGQSVRAVRSEDDPALIVYDATGTSLAFTLEKWRAGSGDADIGPDTDGAGDKVTLTLRHLIAFGHYSVFVRTDDASGAHFVPLDGSGLTNNFDARVDGSANIAISAPGHLASGSWIVTIYHSDAADHGNSPGEFAHTAHQQLILKVP